MTSALRSLARARWRPASPCVVTARRGSSAWGQPAGRRLPLPRAAVALPAPLPGSAADRPALITRRRARLLRLADPTLLTLAPG